MSYLVKDVQEALKDMAVSMSDLAVATKGNQGRAEWRRKKGDPDSDESSEDEVTPPVKSRKKSPAKAATAEHKYYYAVAKGWVSGVYTNWGQALKQVNEFSGALHKKFKSQVDAERFVKKYREPETDVSENSSGPPESESEDLSENELPKAKPRKMKPRKERAGAGFPPLELTAPDPSTRNAKELFHMTIAGDQQMTAKLSPPGLDA
jgi:hypothetical protein